MRQWAASSLREWTSNKTRWNRRSWAVGRCLGSWRKQDCVNSCRQKRDTCEWPGCLSFFLASFTNRHTGSGQTPRVLLETVLECVGGCKDGILGWIVLFFLCSRANLEHNPDLLSWEGLPEIDLHSRWPPWTQQHLRWPGSPERPSRSCRWSVTTQIGYKLSNLLLSPLEHRFQRRKCLWSNRLHSLEKRQETEMRRRKRWRNITKMTHFFF